MLLQVEIMKKSLINQVTGIDGQNENEMANEQGKHGAGRG